jgi:hypothetical protein
VLIDRFTCLDSDAAVRAAVTGLGIRYVFLGSGFVVPGVQRVAGLVGLASSPSLTLVHVEPGVQVYEVHLAAQPGPETAGCRSARGGAPG